MKKMPLNLKKTLAVLASGSLLFGAGFKVFADNLDYSQIPGMPKIELMTGDDRWGCEVLLCLANPNGPRAVSECRPPIDKLFKCLAKPHHPCKFPTCPMAGEGNYAKQLNDSFDPCSLQGMEDAPKGYLTQGNLNDSSLFKTGRRNQKYLKKRASYNHGGEIKINDEDGSYWGGSKACVRGYQGVAYEAYECGDSESSSTCYRPVKVYEEVVWQKQQSRRAIDVFINGKTWNRVHW